MPLSGVSTRSGDLARFTFKGLDGTMTDVHLPARRLEGPAHRLGAATMKLALGLDVQTNAKGGKFMSIEDSHQWDPGCGQEGGCVLCDQHRPGAVDGGGGAGRHRQQIVFQKPFPGAARTKLESQLQRAVKVSAKGKHVKCKIDLERCLFPATACRARSSRVARAARLRRPGTCG